MALLMVDVDGVELNAEDKDILAHPKVGGLILFSRNFTDIEQLCQLTRAIKQVNPKLLIAVDQEGGRVQRFRQDFSAIPAMGKIFPSFAQICDQAEALQKSQQFAQAMGYLMAREVQASGIDISFAPVLDLDDVSEVIGDRGFHRDPAIVNALGDAFIVGMHLAGMKATGKHFPGHGSVKEDSHIAMPIDKRSKQQIFAKDIQTFEQLNDKGMLDAMMPAHVIYPNVDQHPVGFSRLWLQDILRQQMGFDGVLFSDDLSMQGATGVGGFVERCEAAATAGCDMLLVCNNRQGAIAAIEQASINASDLMSVQRIQLMLNTTPRPWSSLGDDAVWQSCRQQLQAFNAMV
ncbi:beta-N-acetylhexosaminidase [Thalassotalea sp. Y01]|uniref:beta-N-acetylhexosaminidase n=1 Tax=Thalassotalea sp. Y01 TaxID=2729613 RepID=UPI0020070B4F|nr:beta-N-acetylhexosaminidase [Thalassotalea sp. Y01]